MATVTGSNGSIKVATSGGSVAAVAEVRSFTLARAADAIEDTVMGDTHRTYAQGQGSATLSVDCYWDSSDSTGQLVLDERASIDFELYPEGTGSGSVYYSGSGIVTASDITASFDGMVEATFSVQVSGSLTESTVS